MSGKCLVLSGPVRTMSETCPVLLSDPVRKMSGMSGNVRECPEKCPECPIRAQAHVGAAHEGPPSQWIPGRPELRNPSNGVPRAPTLLPLGCREGTCGAGIRRVRIDVPPLHFARPPTPGASSWPGATLAIQGGIEGKRRPHPSSGRKARREGEEKAPLPFNG